MTLERRDSRKLAALTALLRDAVKPPTPLELDRGLNALRAQIVRSFRRRVAPRRLLLAAALVSLFGLVAVFVPRLYPSATERTVSVAHIYGGKILEGGYLSEVGHDGVKLYFNEGSQFILAPGTRGRLGALGAEGARLALDHGTASFRITPNPERRWWVEAGPFLVSVRGTEFTVEWDPKSERFAVQLQQGRVAVSGPVVGEELVLRPGQNLSVSLASGETIISEGRPQKQPEAAGAEVAPTLSAASPERGASGAPSAVSAAPPARPASSASKIDRGWREALANGQWDRILGDVERDGVENSLRTLSSDELFMLADAARYRRRPDLARASLLAQRERFPSSSRALDAVFLLGRVEEMRAGRKTAAIARYDEYLSSAPAGTYAAEALGRKMILLKEVAGPDSARQAAAEYLKRFPRGSYAEAARSLERIP